MTRIWYHDNTADVETSLPFTHAFNSPEGDVRGKKRRNVKLKWLPNDFLILRFPNHSSSVGGPGNPTNDMRLAVALS